MAAKKRDFKEFEGILKKANNQIYSQNNVHSLSLTHLIDNAEQSLASLTAVRRKESHSRKQVKSKVDADCGVSKKITFLLRVSIQGKKTFLAA